MFSYLRPVLGNPPRTMSSLFLEISDLARCGFPLIIRQPAQGCISVRTVGSLSPRFGVEPGGLCANDNSQLIRGEGGFRAYGLDHGGISDVEHIQAQIKPAGRLAARGCAQSRHRPGRSLYRGVRCGLQRTTPSAGPYASGRQTKESRPVS